MNRKHALRWIGISAAALFAVLALALLLLFTMDLARFQDELEAFLGEFTGREVVINGEFEASLGRTVAIRIEDARLGNASWSSAPHMLRVGELELQFGLWSVFRDTLKIEYLRLNDIEVLVEADADHGLNWSFDPSTGIEEWLASRSVTQYTFEHAKFTDIRLRYGDGWLDEARTLEVIHCALEETEDDFLALELDGRLDDFDITISGRAGPQQSLAKGENISLDITTDVGDFRLVTRGFFQQINPMRWPEISFEFVGPDVATLLVEVGLPEFTSGPVDLRGDLDQDPPGVKLDVSGSVGEVQLDVHGTLEDVEQMTGLAMEGSVSGPHLRDLLRMFRVGELPPGAFRVGGRIAGDEPPFALSDVAISIGEFSAEISGSVDTDDAELDISASGPDFAAFFGTWTEQPLPGGAFEIDGRVLRRFNEDSWAVSDAALTLEEYGIESEFDGSVRTDGIELRVSGSGQDFATFFGTWTERPLPTGGFEISGGVSRQYSDKVWNLADASARLATGMEFRFDGGLEPTADYLGVNATLAALGPELGDALALWFDNPPGMGPFIASAELDKDRDASRWNDVEAMVGGDKHPADIASGANHLAGTILYEPGDKPRVTAELRTEGFDITPFVNMVKIPLTQKSNRPNPRQTAGFLTLACLSRYLDVADLDVRLDADNIQLGEFEATDVGLRLLARDGNLAIDPANAVFRGGNVSGRLANRNWRRATATGC